MSAAEIRERARKFERKILLNNILNYGVAAGGVALIGFFILHVHNLLFRLGASVGAAVTMNFAWQMHRKSPFRRLPEAMGGATGIEFLRGELARRRDYCREFLRQVLPPTIPVWLLFMGALLQLHPRHLGWRAAVANGAVAVVFWGLCAQSRWYARKLQEQIDELDRM